MTPGQVEPELLPELAVLNGHQPECLRARVMAGHMIWVTVAMVLGMLDVLAALHVFSVLRVLNVLCVAMARRGLSGVCEPARAPSLCLNATGPTATRTAEKLLPAVLTGHARTAAPGGGRIENLAPVLTARIEAHSAGTQFLRSHDRTFQLGQPGHSEGLGEAHAQQQGPQEVPAEGHGLQHSGPGRSKTAGGQQVLVVQEVGPEVRRGPWGGGGWRCGGCGCAGRGARGDRWGGGGGRACGGRKLLLEQEELPLVGPQLPQLGGGAESRLPVDAAAGSGRIGGMREVRHEMG